MTWRSYPAGRPTSKFVAAVPTAERLADLRSAATWRAGAFTWAEEHLQLFAHIDNLTAQLVAHQVQPLTWHVGSGECVSLWEGKVLRAVVGVTQWWLVEPGSDRHKHEGIEDGKTAAMSATLAALTKCGART
jgi:hypothetical protein